MVYCGLYYFHGASCREEADEPVKYFTNPDVRNVGALLKNSEKPLQSL